jgi:hypothetical protein
MNATRGQGRREPEPGEEKQIASAGAGGAAGSTTCGGAGGGPGLASDGGSTVPGASGAGGSASSPTPRPASFSSVAFGNDVLFAAGFLSNATGLIYRSVDGLSWRAVVLNEPGLFMDVKFGNGRFVALLSQSWGITAPYESDDGTTWTKADPPDPGFGQKVAFGAGTFAMSAKDGFLTSSDGLSWTLSAWPMPENGGVTSARITSWDGGVAGLWRCR